MLRKGNDRHHWINYLWIALITPIFLMWTVIIELSMNLIVYISRVFIDLVSVILKESSIIAMLFIILLSPISVFLALIQKILLALFRSLHNTLRKTVLLYSFDFKGNVKKIVFWEMPNIEPTFHGNRWS